jgi:hypothetical protein
MDDSHFWSHTAQSPKQRRAHWRFSLTEEWLLCLSVLHKNEKSLLALNFGDDKIGRSPLLLDVEKPGEQHCLQLGAAEFRFTYPNSVVSRPGNLQLGSLGVAIVGGVNVLQKPPAPHAWLALTGEPTAIEGTALRPPAWEVGIMNSAAEFEKLLGFRDGVAV